MVGTVGIVRRRLAAALFVLALVAAACGSSGHRNHLERATGPSPLESTVPETTPSTAAAAAPSTAPPQTPGPTGARRPVATAPRRSTGGAPAGGGGAAGGGSPGPGNLAAVRVVLTPVAGISGALAMATRANDG